MKALRYSMMLLACLQGCCLLDGLGQAWELRLSPEIIQEVIPGQQCILLVEISPKWEGGELNEETTVTLSATAGGAQVRIEPETMTPGVVAEVTVIPADDQAGQALPVTITGTADGQQDTVATSLDVIEGDIAEYQSSIGPAAEVHRDRFVAWLAENHPELGITEQTEWDSLVVSPRILVVTHHLFLSDDWEMHVYWHVMIPPDDWARIDLRRRFEESAYSQGFEISSVSDDTQVPHPIAPSERLSR